MSLFARVYVCMCVCVYVCMCLCVYVCVWYVIHAVANLLCSLHHTRTLAECQPYG